MSLGKDIFDNIPGSLCSEDAALSQKYHGSLCSEDAALSQKYNIRELQEEPDTPPLEMICELQLTECIIYCYKLQVQLTEYNVFSKL